MYENYTATVDLSNLIRRAYKDSNCLDEMGLAIRLMAAGYRLDPYPNGKSKDELIAIIEGQSWQLAKARELLHRATVFLPSEHWFRSDIDAFLTETSTVKP